MIYTSGTTGLPKAVMVEHRSLLNHTLLAARDYALGPADRVLQFASLTFDASAEEIYPCLVRGATLSSATSIQPSINPSMAACKAAWPPTTSAAGARSRMVRMTSARMLG